MAPAKSLANGDAAPLECPRCDVHLEGRLVGDVLLDECNTCHGIWVDLCALERILSERKQARADVVLGKLPPAGAPPVPHQQTRMYIRCPECVDLMNRRLFAKGSGVIVDICPKHGAWFDESELQLVIEFVAKGGLVTPVNKKNTRPDLPDDFQWKPSGRSPNRTRTGRNLSYGGLLEVIFDILS